MDNGEWIELEGPALPYHLDLGKKAMWEDNQQKYLKVCHAVLWPCCHRDLSGVAMLLQVWQGCSSGYQGSPCCGYVGRRVAGQPALCAARLRRVEGIGTELDARVILEGRGHR